MAGNFRILYIEENRDQQLNIQEKVNEAQLSWSITFAKSFEEARTKINIDPPYHLFIAESEKVQKNELPQLSIENSPPIILLSQATRTDDKSPPEGKIHHVRKDSGGLFLQEIQDLVEYKEVPEPRRKISPVLSTKKILIGEDNPMNKKLILKMLERWGLQPIILSNGALVIEELQREPYDLLLIDLQMPVMNGIETIKHIRHQMKLDLKIILMTAVLYEKSYIEILPLIQGMLPKPFSAENLFGHIKKSLLDNIANYYSPNFNEELFQNIKKKHYDLSFLERTSRGNTTFVREMIEIFIQQVETFSPQITKLLQLKDTDKLYLNIHTIKSSARHVGSLELCQLCEDIETYLSKHTIGDSLAVPMFQAFTRISSICCQQLKAVLDNKSENDTIKDKSQPEHEK